MTDITSLEYSSPYRRLTLDEMKQFLWGAATRLRGQIDAAGYKEYIFPLLFFKRISDVYDEQFNGYVAEGGEEYANMQVEDFAIKIPDGAHWRDVRAVTENVGQRLVEAFIAIEQANPGVHTDGRVVGGLEGIFGPKDIWTNKNKMPDHIITSLIEDFSRYNLSIAACPADEMGQAYEYLVGKFADDAGNTAQEFYTNRTVVTLMAEILKPKPGESIYDPTCGSGGMLVKCLDYLREKGEAWQSVKVFGQEINALTSSIARMNLYLNGVEDFSIVREDTLKHPAFVDGSHLRTFDVVLANPPYSIKAWDRDAFANDKWGRNFLGTPPQGRADYAFLQHIIASMDSKSGRCAILFPHGVLFRKEEKEMREALIKSDKIEAVIGLGANLFYNSPMEACILICNNNKPASRKGKILMINALKEVVRKNAESYLLPVHISKILTAFQSGKLIEGFSALVDNNEIIKKNSDLTISLYAYSSGIALGNSNQNNPFDEWQAQETALFNAIYELANLIGIDISSSSPHDLCFPKREDWITVKLGEVAHEVKETWKGDTIDVPVVGLEHLTPGDMKLSNWNLNPEESTFTKKFSAGQILLGRRRAYQKKASIAEFDGICSGDITIIEADKPEQRKNLLANESDRIHVYPKLLPFIIQNDRFFDFAVQGSAGSLSPRVKWEHLKDYEFGIPTSMDVQKRLADTLWAAYRLKEAYKHLLSATDEMVKSQFIEMFGSPDTPIAKGHDLFTFASGKSMVKSELSNEYPYDCYGGNGITGKARDFLVANTTIVIGRVGEYCGCVHKTTEKSWITDNAIYVKSHSNRLLLDFAFHAFIIADFHKFATESGQPKITQEPLLSYEFPVPSIKEQEVFINIVRQADKSKFDGFKSQFIEHFRCDQCAYLPLREVCLRYGEYGSNTPSIPFEEGHPRYIRITDLNYDGTLNDDKVCAKEIDKKYILSKGDFLFARTGATVGKTYCHRKGDALYAGYLIRYVTNPDKILPEFLSIYTKTQPFWSWIQGQMKIGAQPNISSKQYNELPVPAPSIEEQTSFLSFVRQADKSKYYVQNKLNYICHILTKQIPLRRCS